MVESHSQIQDIVSQTSQTQGNSNVIGESEKFQGDEKVSDEFRNIDEKSDSDDNGIPLLDNADLFPEGGIKAYTVLFGSFCGMISSLSFLNAAGVLQSYLLENVLTSANPSTVGWIFSINSFVQFGCLLVVGPIFDHFGCRIPLICGLVFQTLGFLCASWCHQTYQFILSYSILGGVGTSLVFGVNIGVLSHWFLRKRAMAIGLSYIGGAIGGALFPVMYQQLFPKIGFGWTVRVGVLIILSFGIMSLVTIQDRRHVFIETDKELKDSVIKQVFKSIDIRVFKDKIYTSLVISLVGQGFAFLVTMTYLTSYSVAQGFSASKSYYLVLTINCVSILGRVIPGIFADMYGRFNALCVIGLSSTIVICVLWLNTRVSHTLVGLFIYAGIFGFTSGSILSLSPACVGQISETKDFAKRTGTAFFVFSFGDLIGIPIGGAIAGNGSSKSYDNMVIFVAVASILGTIGAFIARYLYGGAKLRRI